MATGNVIGRVEVSQGKVRFVDTEGNFRDSGYEGLMYEGEQIYSDDPSALFQIKYEALPEATAYDGVFRVLADGSVIAGLDGNENMFGDDIDLMETAAGGGATDGSSAFLEEVPVDESSLLGFGRGADGTEYGEGDIGTGVIPETDDQTLVPNIAPVANIDDITKIADYTQISGAGEDVVLFSENFEGEDAGNGWSDVRITEGDGNVTNFLGRFGGNTHDEVSKTFDFGEDHAGESVTIEFDMYEIDSWDGNGPGWINELGDSFKVLINDEVVSTTFMGHDGRPINDTDGGTPLDNINQARWSDESHHMTLSVVVGEDGLVKLGFTSTLNQSMGDESWGIDNLLISGGEDWTAGVHTMLPFVIDDTMLLANDTDIDGDALHVELTADTNLYALDGVTVIGSVSINEDGDVQVTPDASVEFDASVEAYANFAYVVVDEDGAVSDATTATINLEVGAIDGTEVGYDQDTQEEFIIGTDEDAPDALTDNALAVDGTLDLSHVSDINNVELGEDATVTGSADLGYVTAGDVLDATDLDNTLYIHSSDGNAHDQVNVHESFGDASPVYNIDDGQWYAQYSADDATLLIEIEPPMDVV